jgi:hypothetical protein
MTCPMCGCAGHQNPKTWQVQCAGCDGQRWPYVIAKPDPYTCSRCRGTSLAKREAARSAGKKSASGRLAKAGLR